MKYKMKNVEDAFALNAFLFGMIFYILSFLIVLCFDMKWVK